MNSLLNELFFLFRDFEKLKDSTRPKKKKPQVKGLSVGPRSRSPFLGIQSHSPHISNLDAELSSVLQSEPESGTCTDSMKGRHTRASTEDTLESAMPSGSGSSRLTSPTGRTGGQKESSVSSPDTPRSGWKRKRQDGDLNSPRFLELGTLPSISGPTLSLLVV